MQELQMVSVEYTQQTQFVSWRMFCGHFLTDLRK